MLLASLLHSHHSIPSCIFIFSPSLFPFCTHSFPLPTTAHLSPLHASPSHHTSLSFSSHIPFFCSSFHSSQTTFFHYSCSSLYNSSLPSPSQLPFPTCVRPHQLLFTSPALPSQVHHRRKGHRWRGGHLRGPPHRDGPQADHGPHLPQLLQTTRVVGRLQVLQVREWEIEGGWQLSAKGWIVLRKGMKLVSDRVERGKSQHVTLRWIGCVLRMSDFIERVLKDCVEERGVMGWPPMIPREWTIIGRRELAGRECWDKESRDVCCGVGLLLCLHCM